MGSAQLKLKVLWSSNFLGLAIDQVKPRYKVPITSYYFWPKTEAWEQLQIELAVKNWVPNAEKSKILNSAAAIMNFWRLNRKSAAFENVVAQFNEVSFVKVNT